MGFIDGQKIPTEDEAQEALSIICRKWDARVRINVRAGSITPATLRELQAALMRHQVRCSLITYTEEERALYQRAGVDDGMDRLIFERWVA